MQQQALAAQRLTEQDILAAVHNQGLEDFSHVRLAISEPNGIISVIPMRQERVALRSGASLRSPG